jgi:hypothetical protein
MIFPSALNIEVQVIAAFLIFVIGYLALLVFAIMCLGASFFIYRGASLLWQYMMRVSVPTARVPAKATVHATSAPHKVAIISRDFAIARRSVP